MFKVVSPDLAIACRLRGPDPGAGGPPPAGLYPAKRPTAEKNSRQAASGFSSTCKPFFFYLQSRDRVREKMTHLSFAQFAAGAPAAGPWLKNRSRSPRPIPPPASPPQPKKILIVDDDDTVRESLNDFLEFHDFVVTAVASAAAALEILAKNEFDLVISDLVMPKMDGIALVKIDPRFGKRRPLPGHDRVRLDRIRGGVDEGRGDGLPDQALEIRPCHADHRRACWKPAPCARWPAKGNITRTCPTATG